MILKDEKRIVKDDYMNFEEIRKLKILDSSLKSSITEANGLRNRLVHEYNGISDAIALDSIKDLIGDIHKIIKRVKKWLAKFSTKFNEDSQKKAQSTDKSKIDLMKKIGLLDIEK